MSDRRISFAKQFPINFYLLAARLLVPAKWLLGETTLRFSLFPAYRLCHLLLDCVQNLWLLWPILV